MTANRWTLWSHDYFDRDTPPSLDAEGAGLYEGLQLLWRKTLEEAVQDDGQATFTSFSLRAAGDTTFLPRDPFANPELARLRGWRDHPGLVESLALAHVHAGIGPVFEAARAATSAAALLARLSGLT